VRDENQRLAIRLGDRTDHGGTVRTAFDKMLVLGIPVAGEGCIVSCPRCGGDYRILRSPSGRRHQGRTIAYDHDVTECGARLLSSLNG
jgi:uncharacterized Zn-binding protein involved in type VI secretion